MLTNQNIHIKASTSDIRFLTEFELYYSLPPDESVLDVKTDGYNFAETSIIIKLKSIQSNEFTLLIKNYEISNFSVPSLPIKAIKGNVTNEYLTPPFPVGSIAFTNTISNKAPVEDIFDFKDYTVFFIILGLLIFAGIGFFLYSYINRIRGSLYGRKEEAEQEDPYAVAIERLRKLEQKKWVEKEAKEVFASVSEITRRFMERTLKFNALEYSTSEILNLLKKESKADSFYKEILDICVHVFRLCDRVKYAKYVPSENDKKTVIEEAMLLVNIVQKHFLPESTVEKEGEK